MPHPLLSPLIQALSSAPTGTTNTPTSSAPNTLSRLAASNLSALNAAAPGTSAAPSGAPSAAPSVSAATHARSTGGAAPAIMLPPKTPLAAGPPPADAAAAAAATANTVPLPAIVSYTNYNAAAGGETLSSRSVMDIRNVAASCGIASAKLLDMVRGVRGTRGGLQIQAQSNQTKPN